MSEERDLQNANVSAMSDQISSVTEERDLLQADLTEMTKELERLQSLFNQSESLSELLCVFVKNLHWNSVIPFSSDRWKYFLIISELTEI